MKLQKNKILIKHLSPSQLFLHSCAHSKNTQSVCLAQVNGKVKRMWVKALFKSDPKVNPNFAYDMPTYTKITNIQAFHPTVIHASYLFSDVDFNNQNSVTL